MRRLGSAASAGHDDVYLMDQWVWHFAITIERRSSCIYRFIGTNVYHVRRSYAIAILHISFYCRCLCRYHDLQKYCDRSNEKGFSTEREKKKESVRIDVVVFVHCLSSPSQRSWADSVTAKRWSFHVVLRHSTRPRCAHKWALCPSRIFFRCPDDTCRFLCALEDLVICTSNLSIKRIPSLCAAISDSNISIINKMCAQLCSACSLACARKCVRVCVDFLCAYRSAVCAVM